MHYPPICASRVPALLDTPALGQTSMHLHHLIKVSLVLTYLVGPSVAARAQTLADKGPVLHPGDHVRITVLGEDKDLSGEFEVATDSTLKHPLYNQLKVVGIPLPMLKERFASFLQRYQKAPQLQVEPLFKVAVAGEVRKPNIYFLAPETTVAEAVTRADGATERADANQVTVLRNGRKLSFNLNPTTLNRDQHTVRSGDQINVAARRDVISGIRGVAPLITVTVSLLSAFLVLSR